MNADPGMLPGIIILIATGLLLVGMLFLLARLLSGGLQVIGRACRLLTTRTIRIEVKVLRDGVSKGPPGRVDPSDLLEFIASGGPPG